MPAPKPRFYSTKDISIMLSVSNRYALDLMHMFEQRGEVLRNGKLIRVTASAFDAWVRQHMTNSAKERM